MRLVIVESPNKVKKIGQFLGHGYQVLPSFGHVRDLPADGGLAIRFANGRIIPQYEVRAKKELVDRLRSAARSADEILLATDPDREGEAISWHLTELIGPGHRYRRVTFNAITEDAVRNAVAAPRDIDMHMVAAQQARRVLDRVVGWLVSPTCGKGAGNAKARSAGRVQSVALRLVVDRDREISAFAPQTFFVLQAQLQKPGTSQLFWARLIKWGTTDIPKGVRKPEDAEMIAGKCRGAPWQVLSVETRMAERSAPAPFSTASLQQAASTKLGLDPEQTMALAQQLFEAGLISYMRTDSTALSPEAIAAARALIAAKYGQSYLPDTPNVHASKSANAQEAHEAIRPTHPGEGRSEAQALGDLHAKLYDLIEERTTASQMAATRFTVTTIDVAAAGGKAIFRVTGNTPQFDEWKKASEDATEEPSEEKSEVVTLPPLAEGDVLAEKEFRVDRSKTKPPPRYTQASLIKKLESDGIGRPSTFAAILKGLFKRGYVEERGRKLNASEVGHQLVDFLARNYGGNFIEYAYTAQMEEDLDRIARGEAEWEPLITTVSNRLLTAAQAAGLSGNPLIGDEPPPRSSSGERSGKSGSGRPCRTCCRPIIMRQVDGKWVALNVDSSPHRCQS